MTWTNDKPSLSGWYWYKEPGRNFNKPMPAWVFNANGRIYVSLMAMHDGRKTDHTVHIDTLKGQWAGPIEMPVG